MPALCPEIDEEDKNYDDKIKQVPLKDKQDKEELQTEEWGVSLDPEDVLQGLSKQAELMRWHYRLGHMHYKKMQRL